MKKQSTILGLCFIMISFHSAAQLDGSLRPHKFVKNTLRVLMTKKQFLLVSTLAVTDIADTISVLKSRYFEEGSCSSSSSYSCGRLYLERQVQNTFINITTNAIRHPDYYQQNQFTKVLTYSQPIIDTLNLGYLYPFEPGIYRIRIEMDYFYQTEKFTKTSALCLFNVAYLPKNSIFNISAAKKRR